MLGIFYGDSDKKEIKNWIDSRASKIEKSTERNLEEINSKVVAYVGSQLNQFNEEIQSQVNLVKGDLVKQSRADFQQVHSEMDALKRDNELLRNQLAALEEKVGTPPPPPQVPSADFQAKIDALEKDNSALKNELAAFKQDHARTINELVAQFNASLQKLYAGVQGQLSALAKDIDALKSVKPQPPSQDLIAGLQTQLDKLKAEVDALKPSPPEPPPPPEKLFYLKDNGEVFISNDVKKIPAQIRKALKVDDIQKFLTANDTQTSKKFQRLLQSHVSSVKSFVDKLKLNKLDEEELSETVTSKYFELFQPYLFDNLIVAIRRGLQTSEEFYPALLKKINAYLERCGIYTVNAKSGVKATDDDYKNMTPQIAQTSDATQAEVISDIERLPYRINYVDEFGDTKFFQYDGTMSIYKVV